MVKIVLLLIVGALGAACAGPPSRGSIFLPVVSSPACLSGEASVLERLLITDSRQQHPTLRCNKTLTKAAEARALNLSQTGLISHCDPTGKCANSYAEEAGCHLPSNYTPNGNNVESFILGPNDTEQAFALLSLSPSHANHLFGRGDFFRAQDEYGLAVLRAPDTTYQYYYLFYLADCQ